MNEVLNEFKKNGYIHFNSGLSSKNINIIRNEILSNFKDGEIGELYLDYAIKNDLIFKTLFLKNIITNLKKISEKIIFLADLNIQVNKISLSGKKRGWHIDSNYEDFLGAKYLYSNDYKFYKVGIYLQDDSIKYGGGIDIKIKGHKAFKNFGKVTLNKLYKKIYNFLAQLLFYRKKRVKIKSGDVLVFDSRLPHSSSKSTIKPININKEKMKIVIYWDVSGRLEDAEEYLKTLIIKSQMNNNKYTKIFNLNNLRHSYPNSFTSEQIRNIENKDVHFLTLEKDEANFFDLQFKKFSNKILSKNINFLQINY